MIQMKFQIVKIHKNFLHKTFFIGTFLYNHFEYTVTVALKNGEVLKLVTNISPESKEFLPEIQFQVGRHLEVEKWCKEESRKLASGKKAEDYIRKEYESINENPNWK